MRTGAERVLAWFSPYVFLGAAQRRLLHGGLPIFTYHKVASAPPGTRDPFLYTDPLEFKAQLDALCRAGYGSTSLLDAVTNGTSRSRKTVITFDDGFLSVFENALEILAAHSFQATLFLVANFLGQENKWDIAKGDVPERLMDEVQVREWLAAGHEIGSHSMTHRNLRQVGPADAREETSASKKALEDRFGVEVRHFCYPFGSWNPYLRDLVAGAGYRTACTVKFGVYASGSSPFELRRIIPLSARALLRKIQHRGLIRTLKRAAAVF